ncbi:MAG TPA: putative metal-binding motif-containing protein [Polyangiaceae bacterium]|nr:putative metal-binding motif-containing protein [Polyangiaceae bacterium]
MLGSSVARFLVVCAPDLALLLAIPCLVSCSFFAPTLEEYARGAAGAGGAASVAQDATDSGGAAGDTSATCTPHAELCNGKDDDCDGTVDNGCPSAFLRGSATQRPALGDSTGGSAFAGVCATDEVITGLQIATSNWLDQVTAVCQKYTLGVNTQVTPYQYSFALGASESLASHPPSTTDSIQALTCPSGTVLVGLNISEQTVTEVSTQYVVITRVSTTCAEPILNLTGTTPQVTWQNPVMIGPLSSSTFDATQATTRSDTLDPTQLSVGLHGASGLWVDQIGLTDSSIQVLVQSP